MKSLLKKIKLFCEYTIILIKRIVINIFNIYPIKNNRILFHSFNGKQYSCNPRAIFEELPNYVPHAEYIWAFNEPEKFEALLPNNAICVKIGTLKYYYYAKTSKVMVFNARGKGELSRRNKQVFIQTWHASNGYKKIKADKGITKRQNHLACKDYSYVLAGTKQMEKERVNGTMNFFGPIIKGTPRMDIIINGNHSRIRNDVFSQLGIDQSKRVLLYAPTYRSRANSSFGLDYENVLAAVTERFGGQWVLLVRLHYFIRKKLENNKRIIDVTDYPDMQDLLIASDVLISDYSSCIWDYSFLKRPCFLLCDDLSSYEKLVNFNVPIREWGFPLAEDNAELKKIIVNYSQIDFENGMRMHHEKMGSYEDGNANERVCSLISKLIV